jgi:hypothetical protein
MASAAVNQFAKDFYAASDVGPSGHQAYVDFFTPKATLIMGPTTFEGHEGVMKFREAGWEKVATRKHTYKGIYPNPEKPEQDVMVYGTVDYGMKDGTKKEGIEWAARMDLTKDAQGNLKLQFYQVYLVS